MSDTCVRVIPSVLTLALSDAWRLFVFCIEDKWVARNMLRVRLLWPQIIVQTHTSVLQVFVRSVFQITRKKVVRLQFMARCRSQVYATLFPQDSSDALI